MDGNGHWVGTWTASPAPSEAGVTINDQTLRMLPRVSLGGDRLRVRISNAYGRGNLAIGAASIALRDKGPAIVEGSARTVAFGGAASVTIAAGAVATSDTVALEAPALADLAVSLHPPGESAPAFQITGRYARQTNYTSPPGNYAADTVMPVGKITDEWFFLCGSPVCCLNLIAEKRRGDF